MTFTPRKITVVFVLYDLDSEEKIQEMTYYFMTFAPRKITVVFVLYDLHSKEKLQKMVHFMTLAPRKITVVFVLYDLIYSKEKWHAGVNYDLNVKEKL